MNTILTRSARTGLLFAAALMVLGGHAVLTRLLLAVANAPLAAAGIASVVASASVFLTTGVFLLPRARRLAGARASAVTVAVGTALVCVAVRALAEACVCASLVGLPIAGMALAAALTGELATTPAARRQSLAPIARGPQPVSFFDRRRAS